MYVVTRTFRTATGIRKMGDIIPLSGITRLKYQINEKHLVKLTSDNLERYVYFFKHKYGIDLLAKITEYEKTRSTDLIVEQATSLEEEKSIVEVSIVEVVKPVVEVEVEEPVVEVEEPVVKATVKPVVTVTIKPVVKATVV